MQDTPTKEELTQLLVVKSLRELLFHVSYYNPTAGHLGQDKTLKHLLVMFAGGMRHVHWIPQ